MAAAQDWPTPVTSLNPYQQRIADELASLRDATGLIIEAPTGAGASGALIETIGEATRSGRVVIVSSHRLILDQWERRLAPAGIKAKVLDSDLALRLAAHAPAPFDGPPVLLTTYQRLLHGTGQQGLQEVAPSLLLIDGHLPIEGRMTAAITDLASRALQTIVLSAVESPAVEWLPGAQRIVLRAVDLIQENLPELSVNVFRPETDGSASRYLLEQAARTLGLSGSSEDAADQAAIHDALLRRVSTEPNLDEGTRARLWDLIDAVENLEPDPWLPALTGAVRELRRIHRVWVITGPRIAQAEYVHAALVNAGIDSTLLTSLGPRVDVAQADVLVLSANMFETFVDDLDDATLLFAQTPLTARQMRLLRGLVATGKVTRIAAVTAHGDPFAGLTDGNG